MSQLPPDQEAIAQRVAELVLAGLTTPPAGELLDTAEVARRLGASESWVRQNADKLGAVRLGDGPKPRLRFDAAEVAQAISSTRTAAPPRSPTPRRSRRKPGGTVDLLPIKGRS